MGIEFTVSAHYHSVEECLKVIVGVFTCRVGGVEDFIDVFQVVLEQFGARLVVNYAKVALAGRGVADDLVEAVYAPADA